MAEGADATWVALQPRLKEALRLHEEIRDVEKNEIGGNNYAQERLRLARRSL